MGENGRQRVIEELNLDRYVEQIADLLKRVDQSWIEKN